jgi:hypothetical protein
MSAVVLGRHPYAMKLGVGGDIVSYRTAFALVFALAGCASDAGTPLEPATRSTKATLEICTWNSSDYAYGNTYLSIVMHPDRSIQIMQYHGDGFYIDSDSVAGLTTVYHDTLVVVQGNLPASSYSPPDNFPGSPPPADTTAVTLAVDLRYHVGPIQKNEKGGIGRRRYPVGLTGTIDGTAIVAGDDLYRNSPFHWSGANGALVFCRD